MSLTNGDFEAGNLSGWETLGDVSIQEASFQSGPTQGRYQALLKSGSDRAEMWQSFKANGGAIFSFDWNFLTDEGTPQWQGYNDQAYIDLHWEDEPTDKHILADTWSTFNASETIFQQETGFNTFSVKIPHDGTLTIRFGVQTTGDAEYQSALLIDNVKITASMCELINGDFEAGNLSGWETLGDVSIQEASFQSGPTQGSYQALLKSGPKRAEMWQSFAGKGGTIFSFDWNFLTDEGTPQWYGYNDKAYIDLHWQDEPGCPHILADTWSNFKASGTIFSKETGFNTFSAKIPNDGLYTIKFGVQTTGDSEYESALLIDNVKCSAPGI